MAYTDIDRSSDYFNTVLYTGDGTTSNSITGVGFQPDWIWIKKRNSIASHRLLDSIRGVQKHLASDNTDAEVTQNSVMSFDTDGFTVGDSAGTNGSSDTFASWNWLASNTTASNTDGSITSTVSANTTSGFSIVSYTGTGANATVGHGLGSEAKMVIVKNRDQADAWYIYHASLGGTKYMSLNSTGSEATNSTLWQDTNPTSSFFYIGTNNVVNTNTENYIVYCFAPKKGFSAMGSYVGNGSSDGSFIYTGFKPAWIFVKRTDGSGGWHIMDNKRDPINPLGNLLLAESSSGTNTVSSNRFDLLSNGFKCRDNSGGTNASGGSYIYMCFSENPFVTSTGIPTTAR